VAVGYQALHLDGQLTVHAIRRRPRCPITRTVKLDFIIGLVLKATETVGITESRNVQAAVGEMIAWRNLFWGLSDAMARAPVPWAGTAVLPSPEYGEAYRVLSNVAYPRIKELIESFLASGLIYINSHAVDFQTPALRPYLARYLRGSDSAAASERVKRHELYERNYAGNSELIRVQTLQSARERGQLDHFKSFAERCMAEYGLDGWTVPDLINPHDVNHWSAACRSQTADA